MTDERAVGEIVIEWYRASLGRDDGTARAARARLRRSKSPAEALAVAETHDLNKLLKKFGKSPTADKLALLATTFAQLKGIEGAKLAAVFGRPRTKGGPRTLSELRFQSLIRIHAHRDLVTPLRRSLAVLDTNPSCDGRALADDLYIWNDTVRNKWCFQYFGAEFAKTNKGETVQ